MASAFSPTDSMTREERRVFERQQKQILFQEHLQCVIDRAPALSFLATRRETEALGIAPLKNFQQVLYIRHLTDLELEFAQKLYEEHLARQVEKVTRGAVSAPDGFTAVKGFVQEVFRQHWGVLRHDEPNRPKILIREDRGFYVMVTCPQVFITGKPAIGQPGPGSLQRLVGWRVGFGIDLMPTLKDPSLGVKRPIELGGTGGSLINPQLLGREFDKEE